MDYAVKSDKKEFIIGTEISIAEHLQYMCPDKTFHILSLKLICPNMKATAASSVVAFFASSGCMKPIIFSRVARAVSP